MQINKELNMDKYPAHEKLYRMFPDPTWLSTIYTTHRDIKKVMPDSETIESVAWSDIHAEFQSLLAEHQALLDAVETAVTYCERSDYEDLDFGLGFEDCALKLISAYKSSLVKE